MLMAQAERIDGSLLQAQATAYFWWIQFGFTQRETEVAVLLAQGLKRNEIARRLDIAETTAKFHINNIIEKTGTESAYHASLVLGLTRPPVSPQPA